MLTESEDIEFDSNTGSDFLSSLSSAQNDETQDSEASDPFGTQNNTHVYDKTQTQSNQGDQQQFYEKGSFVSEKSLNSTQEQQYNQNYQHSPSFSPHTHNNENNTNLKQNNYIGNINNNSTSNHNHRQHEVNSSNIVAHGRDQPAISPSDVASQASSSVTNSSKQNIVESEELEFDSNHQDDFFSSITSPEPPQTKFEDSGYYNNNLNNSVDASQINSSNISPPQIQPIQQSQPSQKTYNHQSQQKSQPQIQTKIFSNNQPYSSPLPQPPSPQPQSQSQSQSQPQQQQQQQYGQQQYNQQQYQGHQQYHQHPQQQYSQQYNQQQQQQSFYPIKAEQNLYNSNTLVPNSTNNMNNYADSATSNNNSRSSSRNSNLSSGGYSESIAYPQQPQQLQPSQQYYQQSQPQYQYQRSQYQQPPPQQQQQPQQQYQPQQQQYQQLHQHQQINFSQNSNTLVSFGFGGRIVVMFPRKAPRLNVLDQSPEDNIPYNQVGKVQILDMKEVLAQTDYASSLIHFPGPVMSANNTGANNTIEQNVAQYIDYQVGKLQNQESASSSNETNDTGVVASKQMKSKKKLWQLMKLLINLYSDRNSTSEEQQSDELAASVREILIQDRKHQQQGHRDLSFIPQTKADHEIQQDLDTLERLLMNGNLEEAVRYAVNAKLWAHAISLSLMTDKKTYQQTAAAFADDTFPDGSPLKALYMMFAERGDSLFQPHVTRTMSTDQFGSFTSAQLIPSKQNKLINNWQDNLSIVLANRTSNAGKIIEKLGDTMWKDLNMVEISHFCYLVADFCASHESFKNRITLIGGDNKRDKRCFITPFSIQQTEIYEYCRRRLNPNYFLPSFQVYKLVYASWLADLGLFSKAMQYVEAIGQVVEKTRHVFVYNPHFVYQLRVLRHRVLEAQKTQVSSSNLSYQKSSTTQSSGGGVTSWILSKIDRGLTRFIHGDVDETNEDQIHPPSHTPIHHQPQKEKQQLQQQQQQYSAQQLNNNQQASQQKQPEKAVQSTKPKEQEGQAKPSENGNQSAGGGWFGSWFGFKRKTREINFGRESNLVFNEKLNRWIPKDADPDTYLQESAPPPPPDMLSMNAVAPGIESSSTATTFQQPTSNARSKYVSVGFSVHAPSPSGSQAASFSPVLPSQDLWKDSKVQEPNQQQEPSEHYQSGAIKQSNQMPPKIFMPPSQPQNQQSNPPYQQWNTNPASPPPQQQDYAPYQQNQSFGDPHPQYFQPQPH